MKTFNDDCFHRWILDYHGVPVVIEDCQNGEEIYSDSEVYGSHVFDIKNNKYVYLPFYADACPKYAVEEIDNWRNDWTSMDDADPLVPKDEEAKAYYLEKIEAFEKMDPKPESLELERPC